MRKNKLLLMLAALMLPLLGLHAGSVLVVELNGGSQYRFELQERPEITMSGSKMVIKSTTTEMDFERSAIKSCYFVDPTGVETLTDKAVSFRQTGTNRFQVTGLTAADAIVVSNMAGQLFNQTVINDGIEAVIDLNSCPKGIYVIKIGKKQTIKITKK